MCFVNFSALSVYCELKYVENCKKKGYKFEICSPWPERNRSGKNDIFLLRSNAQHFFLSWQAADVTLPPPSNQLVQRYIRHAVYWPVSLEEQPAAESIVDPQLQT